MGTIIYYFIDQTGNLKTIVVCASNDEGSNTPENRCDLARDVRFVVNGTEARNVTSIQNVASWKARSLCIQISFDDDKNAKNYPEGISLDITVTGVNVTLDDGACIISHVIWETTPQ